MHVPYKGSAPLITDLLGSHIATAFDNYVPGMEQVKAGKLRVLATTSGKRLAAAPDIPTVAEAGVPGYDIRLWLGVFAPVGTHKDVIVRLNAEINRALALPDVRKAIFETGGDIELMTPEQFATFVREELMQGEKLVKLSGAQLE
jgi:tripartite-type tricarboxylate transporter receptor subunit TctC